MSYGIPRRSVHHWGLFLNSTESLKTNYLRPGVRYLSAGIHWLTLIEGMVTEVGCLIPVENWVTIRGCCLLSIECWLFTGRGLLTSMESLNSIKGHCWTHTESLLRITVQVLRPIENLLRIKRGSERLEGRPEAKLELCPVLPRQEDLEKLKSLRCLEDGGVLRDWDEDLKLSWSSVLVLLWQEDLEKLNSPRCLEDGEDKETGRAGTYG
eukprot:XP_008762204.1 PREDICTED: uncharacterized protein LOC102554130 [Rattus norvegicus]